MIGLSYQTIIIQSLISKNLFQRTYLAFFFLIFGKGVFKAFFIASSKVYNCFFSAWGGVSPIN